MKKHIFDDPKNVKRLLTAFYAVLGVLVVIDLLVTKHPHFAWETYPSFYAAYGFAACVVLVLVAKYVLRPLIKRKEDYYD